MKKHQFSRTVTACDEWLQIPQDTARIVINLALAAQRGILIKQKRTKKGNGQIVITISPKHECLGNA